MLKWLNNKKKDNKGFSLVELIIVVAIMAILVGREIKKICRC